MITFEESIKRASKAFRNLFRAMSVAHRSGYYIENRRGRNKLVKVKK